MPIGPIVRSLFGRHEHAIASLYRAMFVDIDAYAAHIRRWVPSAERILEVGCGEGAVTEKLAQAYPNARITAIDITPRVGRLYRGPRDNVSFQQTTVQEIAAQSPQQYDFVIISDVIHHVPVSLREELMEAVGRTLAPGGTLIFKDWQKNAAPIHWMCHAGDRWLTGDKVSYLNLQQARDLVEKAVQTATGKQRRFITEEARIAPWNNNFALLVRA